MADAQAPVPCNACDDDVPGEFYCIDCQQTLCSQCEIFHRKFTKDHNLILRSQLGEVDTTTLTCIDHGVQASVHCGKCDIPICIKCVTGNHQGHRMIEFTDIFEKNKKILENHLNKMQKEILPELERRKDTNDLKRQKYELKVQEISKIMEEENKLIHKEIDRINNEQQKNLIDIEESHLLVFESDAKDIKEKSELCQKMITEYKDIIEKDSLPAVVKLASRKDALPAIGNYLDLPDPPTYVPGMIKRIRENLGNIQPFKQVNLKQTTTTIVSKFTSPLKGTPSICITSEGKVWLGGCESREIALVGIKGLVHGKRKIQHKPHTLAVMECGDFIISPLRKDSTIISRLYADGREQQIFDASPSESMGVSVTADQKILICLWDGRVVKTNGFKLYMFEQLYKGLGEGSASYAVEKDDNIFISDSKSSAIVVVHKNGQVLSRFQNTKEGRRIQVPLALTVDRVGNILCADKDNHCIYIIDQNQEIRELIGSTQGIKKPRQLVIDNDNNLWITQFDGNVYVVKYLA